MSEINEPKVYKVRFADKSVWNEFKDDLKTTFRKHGIKFQYSEKTPIFHILYKSDVIKIRVTWEEETLHFDLQANKSITSEQISACCDIYDILILFSGELVEGDSPYEW